MTRLVALMALLGVLLMAACGEGEEGGEGTAVPAPTGQTASSTPQGTPMPATPVDTPEASVPMGKIAFTSRRDGNGEVYLLTAKGETNITNNPAEDVESDLSPDGKKIVFASNRDGAFRIYVVNVDGSSLARLTDGPEGDLSPKWSPDGTQIAFARAGGLIVMDGDGGNARQVMEAELAATAPLCKEGAFVGGWSPDGQQLTFYAANATENVGQVCTINLDGSGLTVVASEPPGYHVEPSWSPDGQWIAYRFIDGGNHEIYVVKPDGSSRVNLTNHPAADIEPDWSPDGKWIVFASDRTDFFDLYVMRADGSGAPLRLTTSSGKDSEPSWGP